MSIVGLEVAAAVDLRRLATLCGCTVADLARGAQTPDDITAVGVVAEPRQGVLFEKSRIATEPDEVGGVTVALLSLASRPSVLDTQLLPKALLPLAGEPVIAHVLRQLHIGGIQRVVVVIGHQGRRIREAVADLTIARLLRIDYVDLGETYADGFARSLMASRSALGVDRFIFATADHIFDPVLIRSMRAALDDESTDAVALIEPAMDHLKGLPPTMVRVALGEDGASIASIGKQLAPSLRAGGIEAGLYAWTSAALDSLDEMGLMRTYFTVAQAMQRLASRGRLRARFTEGRAWFAIETPDQLSFTRSQVEVDLAEAAAARRAAGEPPAVRFPWQARIARADSLTTLHGMQATPAGAVPTYRLVLALEAAGTSLRPLQTLAEPEQRHEEVRQASAATGRPEPPAVPPARQAYTLLVSTDELLVQSPPLRPTASPAGGSTPWPVALAEPLLPASSQEATASAADYSMFLTAVPGSITSTSSTAHGSSEKPDPLPTSPGLQRQSSTRLEAAAAALGEDATLTIAVGNGEVASDVAYLLGVPPSHSSSHGATEQVVLALPQPADDAVFDSGHGCLVPYSLPSAVQSVRVTVVASEAGSDAEAVADGAHIQLTVEKSVPLVGWLLLAAALTLSNSGGPAADLQVKGDPSPPEPWLRAAWRGMCSAAGTFLFVLLQPGGLRSLGQVPMLPREQARLLLGAGAAFFVNFGGFTLALANTSVSHAALFESTASLWMVVGQFVAHRLGKAVAVPRMQGIGVACGALGVAACFFDAPVESPDGDAASRPPHPPLGDAFALLAGLGSCVYLSLGEALRSHLDPAIFYGCVLLQYTLYCLGAAYVYDGATPTLSTDPAHGLFGWINPTGPRLLSQLWMLGAVDLLGNMGYIAVLRYVPSLTVAVAMLLSPLIAAVEGICLGVESLPGPLTWAGATVIVASSAVIVADSQSQSTTVELKMA